jgi:hypothetical protein
MGGHTEGVGIGAAQSPGFGLTSKSLSRDP